MLPVAIPVHKGLAPSGLSFTKLSFVKDLLLNLPFKAHTRNIINWADNVNYEQFCPTLNSIEYLHLNQNKMSMNVKINYFSGSKKQHP